MPDATNLYLDGVQPFVQYRRLLSLALLVRRYYHTLIPQDTPSIYTPSIYTYALSVHAPESTFAHLNTHVTRPHSHISTALSFLPLFVLALCPRAYCSLTDNPLLPTELFATPHRHYTGNIDISLRQAETLLSNLEAGLVNTAGPHADVSGLGMGPGPGAGGNKHHHSHQNNHHQSQKNLSNQALVSANTNANTHTNMNSLDHSSFPVLDLAHTQLSWTIKFEMCRRKLVARKLQTVVRAFLNHASVVIPRTVRGMLRPGYLRGVRGIRTRQVISSTSHGGSQLKSPLTIPLLSITLLNPPSPIIPIETLNTLYIR